MPGRLLNILLFLALMATVGLNWLAGRDTSQPNLEYLPEMVHSVPYDAFAANPVFADGKTLQQPAMGTIIRGNMPLAYAAGPEEALRAGRELTSPYPSDDQNVLKRGGFVYAAFCQHCHGPTGLGDGAVALRGFPPPPSLLADQARQLPNGRMFHILTFGQGNMPSHASQLTPADRWKVIAYLRTLQSRAKTQAAAAAAAAATAAAAAAAEGQP